MRMSEKYRNSNKHDNNNSDNPLTSRRTDGGKNIYTYSDRCEFETKNLSLAVAECAAYNSSSSTFDVHCPYI